MDLCDCSDSRGIACYTGRVMADTLEHPAANVPAGRYAGLLSGRRRPLTIGLVLLVTLVAFEGLAVATALPVVRRDLGGIELYGLVFSAYMLTNLVGITFAGQQADQLPPQGHSRPDWSCSDGAGDIGGGAVDGRSGCREGGAGVWGRLHQHSGLCDDSPRVRGELRPRMFALMSSAWVLPGVWARAAGAVAEHFSWRLVFLGLLPLLPLNMMMTLPAIRQLGPPPATEAGREWRMPSSFQLAPGWSWAAWRCGCYPPRRRWWPGARTRYRP